VTAEKNFTMFATAIKNIIFKTEQKPLFNEVKIKNSKTFSKAY
jgi:hypothetical protein